MERARALIALESTNLARNALSAVREPSSVVGVTRLQAFLHPSVYEDRVNHLSDWLNPIEALPL